MMHKIAKSLGTKNKATQGFTIVELMIATAVFSMVLILCATSVVQIGRMFYKGVTVSRTQDTARKVIDDISESIQFGVNTTGFMRSASGVVCLGEVRYTYNTGLSLGAKAVQSPHILWKDQLAITLPCVAVDLTQSIPSAGGVELLGSNMRIPRLVVTPSVVNTVDVWAVRVTVSYGETADLFVKDPVTGIYDFSKCISNSAGGQFCAVSIIDTSVVKRL